MATVGANALTLNDYKKRMAPGGYIDEIIEVLAQSNPILDDMTWMEGNLLTGNKTTLRSALPTPGIRYINAGITPDKSSTKQIVDTSVILESRSEVDTELLALAPDKEAFRRSEDKGFIEAFGQKVAEMVMYGNTEVSPDTFNGLDIRHRIMGVNTVTAQGYTTIDAGGTTASSMTSAFLVEWGDRATTGIYPREATAGLVHEDLGRRTVYDAAGKPFEAMVSLFKWKCGLTCRDFRGAGAVRNILPSLLTTGTAAQKLGIMGSILKAHDRMRHPERCVLYVSTELYTALKIYLMDKTNSYVTRETLENGINILRVDGMKVVRLDCMINTESQFT